MSQAIIAPVADRVQADVPDGNCVSNGAGEDGSGVAFLVTPARFAAALAAVIAASFPAVLLGLRTFVFRDYGIFGYPLAHYYRQSFWRGELPLWNALSDCGVPFLAQWNTLTLYPLSAIYLLLPLPWSLSLFCLTHLFLAGLGMYFLAFRWTGNSWAAAGAGIAFAFNGLTLNCLMWPPFIAALAWMPWVVLTVQTAWAKGGRHIILAALVGALQMLTGAPELILFTWLVLLGLMVCELCKRARPGIRNVLLRSGGVVFLVAALSAAQLLPFLDLLAHSDRDSTFGRNDWAMPVWGWMNLVLPLFRCFESPAGVYFQSQQYWTSSYYPGVGVLLLSLCAAILVRTPTVGLLWGCALMGFVLAIGEAGYLYIWVRKLCPALGFMRFPIKFALLATFALPLLAAYGLSAVWSPRFSSLARRAGITLWLSLIAAIAGGLWFSYLHPREQLSWSVICQNGITRATLLLLIGGIAFYGFRQTTERRRLLLAWTLLILLTGDALTHVPRQNPTVVPSVYRESMLADTLRPKPSLGSTRAFLARNPHDTLYNRMLSELEKDYIGRRISLLGNCNLLEEVPIAGGFCALHLHEQRRIWEQFFFASPNYFPAGLADFVGISYRATNLFEWESRPGALPWATLGQRPVFLPPADMVSHMVSTNFNPRQVVLLPPEAQQSVKVTNATAGSILSSNWANGRVELEVQALAPTLLVLSQSYYHRWRAYVDDEPTKIWRANYAFQAMEIPRGTHQVKLAYEDKAFQLGCVISLSAVAFCLFGWFRWRRSTLKRESW